MYAYPIYKNVVYVFAALLALFLRDRKKYIAHFSCLTVFPPRQEYIQEEIWQM